MSWKKLCSEVVGKAGLEMQKKKDIGFGMLSGFPVRVAYLKTGKQEFLVMSLLFSDESATSSIARDLETLGILPEAKARLKTLSVQPGVAVLTLERALFGNPSADQLASALKGMADLAKKHLPSFRPTCDRCKSQSVSLPVLLNGSLGLICESCITVLREEVGQAARAFQRIEVNKAAAILVGAVAAVVAAAAWASVVVLTQTMFALLGLGMGYGIGFLVLRAAGKPGLFVQVVSGSYAIASVLLGNLMFEWYYMFKTYEAAGQSLDLAILVESIPEIMAGDPGNLAFGLACGVGGAAYAASQAAAPSFELDIDRLKNA